MPHHIHIIMDAISQFGLGLVGRDLVAVGTDLGVDCWGRKLHRSAG